MTKINLRTLTNWVELPSFAFHILKVSKKTNFSQGGRHTLILQSRVQSPFSKFYLTLNRNTSGLKRNFLWEVVEKGLVPPFFFLTKNNFLLIEEKENCLGYKPQEQNRKKKSKLENDNLKEQYNQIE